jgi:endonuclease/exonuclease/phosphatase (EEP) superfamily protein YafD
VLTLPGALLLALLLAPTGFWWLGLLGAVAAIAGITTRKPLQKPRTHGAAIKILASNLWLKNSETLELCELITELDPHVVITAETTSELRRELSRKLPNHQHVVTGEGPRGAMVTIWAKRDFTQRVKEHGTTPIGDHAQLPWILWREGDQDLLVLGVHLHAPINRRDASIWQAELEAMRGFLWNSDGAVVAGGDFNAGRLHAGMRRLTKIARPAHGRLPRPTWPSGPGRWRRIALLDIDHMLVKQTSVIAATTHRMPGSDHRALLAEISTGEEVGGGTRAPTVTAIPLKRGESHR